MKKIKELHSKLNFDIFEEIKNLTAFNIRYLDTSSKQKLNNIVINQKELQLYNIIDDNIHIYDISVIKNKIDTRTAAACTRTSS